MEKVLVKFLNDDDFQGVHYEINSLVSVPEDQVENLPENSVIYDAEPDEIHRVVVHEKPKAKKEAKKD